MGLAAMAKGNNTINHILQDQELCPMIADQLMIRGEAQEVVTALVILSGVEGNGTGGPRWHGIVVFLMSLYIAAELQVTVFIVVQIEPS